MTDIFREVEEDIRRDQMKRLWDRFGPYVIGLAVLIVVATAGYRGWEYWQKSRAETSGDSFMAALDLSDAGKHEEAIAAYQKLIADGSGAYPMLSRFRIATEKAASGDKTGAVADFDAIAGDSSVPADLQTLARLRAALLLTDTASFADLQQRIGDLAETGSLWRQSAREVLGLAAWRSGDFVAARKYFTEIVNDQDSSSQLRQRSQLMLTLIDSSIGPAAPPASDASGASAPPPASDSSSSSATPPADQTPPATDTPPAN